jgi:hypothetical protein
LIALADVLADLLVQLVDGVRHLGAVHLHRTLHPGAPARPRFPFRIARLHEQNEFLLGMAGEQETHRLGFLKSGQIQQIAVLPVAILDIVGSRRHGRGREQGGRVRPDLVQKRTPAAREHLRHQDHEVIVTCL